MRHHLRRLRKDKGFTITALATLALGIGASVAIFTVVNAVLLRPLPYPAADRLVRIGPDRNFNATLSDAVGAIPSLEASTGVAVWSLTLTGAGDPVSLSTQVVDPSFFRVFGVRPTLGRPFTPEERDPSRSDVVILSDALWRRRFSADPDIIGRRVRLDGYGTEARTVVGVMPRGFVPPVAPPEADVQLWIPLSLPPGATFATDSTWYVNWVIGRMRPGATVEGVAQEARTAMARLRATAPQLLTAEDARTLGASGLLDSMVGDVRGTLLVLLAAVALVLLLACANLASLLLARADRHRQEFAVRAALGAPRSTLVRERLGESVLLAVAGGALGVLVARLVLAALRVSDASGLPRIEGLGLDARVVGFAVGVSLLCAIGFGLVPALRSTSVDLRESLGSGGRTHGRTPARRRLGAVLIGGEVALALIVVTGATLLLGSLHALRSVDPGLDAHDVLAVQLEPPAARYEGEAARTYYRELTDRLLALPGVKHVGGIHLLPFAQGNWAFPYLAEGHEPPANAPLPSANFRVVTPGYFRAAGIPLLEGRDVSWSDDGWKSALLNRAMAEQLWPGEDPIGKQILLFGSDPFRVVGVVGDVHQEGLDRKPRPEMYFPQGGSRVTQMVMMVEASVPPSSLGPAVRRAVNEVAGDVPVVRIRPLEDVLGDSMRQRSFFAGILTFFAVLALALGAVGVYGVMAYRMGTRRPEFGVRMAFGATSANVLRGALLSGAVPVVVGLAVGLLGALLGTRLLTSLLFGIGATDPVSFAAAVVVLGAVGVAAIAVPAWRASRLDPASVLRSE